MNVLALDTETELFSAGRMCPPLVCISWQRPGFEPQLVHGGGIDDRGALELVETALKNEFLVGHHIVYDLGVLCAKWPHLVPLVFQAYDEDRITCTKLRQQLLDIAAGEFRGKLQEFSKEVKDDTEGAAEGATKTVHGARWVVHNYDLDAVCYRATGRRLEKDVWRLRYAEFKSTPITQWPEGARIYPKEDARAT